MQIWGFKITLIQIRTMQGPTVVAFWCHWNFRLNKLVNYKYGQKEWEQNFVW